MCLTSYTNFDKYYDELSNLDKSQLLSKEKPWVRPLKALCKKGIHISLDRMSRATTADMDPNMSGYIFGLGYYLMTQPEKFFKLITACRNGTQFSKELILESYGYEDDVSFEKDWYAFLKSSDFK